jgi:hypothetical protein
MDIDDGSDDDDATRMSNWRNPKTVSDSTVDDDNSVSTIDQQPSDILDADEDPAPDHAEMSPSMNLDLLDEPPELPPD